MPRLAPLFVIVVAQGIDRLAGAPPRRCRRHGKELPTTRTYPDRRPDPGLYPHTVLWPRHELHDELLPGIFSQSPKRSSESATFPTAVHRTSRSSAMMRA